MKLKKKMVAKTRNKNNDKTRIKNKSKDY